MKRGLRVDPHFSTVFGAGGGVGDLSLIATAQKAFTENANSTAWYGNPVSPPAEYFADINKTVIVFEAYNGKAGSERECQVILYDHTTGLFSPVYYVFTNLIIDDSHSVPSITRTDEGHFVVFGGGHSSNMKVAISTNPNDISAWTVLADMTNGNPTEDGIGYPHGNSMPDGLLYLFLRNDEGDPVQIRYGDINIGTPTGASIAWGGLDRYADLGTDSRMYHGTPCIDGNDIIMVFTRANHGDTHRRGVYVFRFDTTDKSIHNLDRSHSVSFATWGATPIGLTEWNANFRVFDHGLRFGSVPGATLVNNDLHIVFQNGVDDADELYWMWSPKGALSFSTPIKLADDFAGSTPYCITKENTSPVVWYRKADNAIYMRNIEFDNPGYTLEAEEKMFRPSVGQQCDIPAAVRSAHSSLSMVFANSDDDETVEGMFNLYAVSGSSFVSGDGQVRGIVKNLLASAGIDPGDLASPINDAYSTFLDAALSAGHWQRLRAFWLLDPIRGIHLRNWKLNRFALTEVGTGSGFDSGLLGWRSNSTDRYLNTNMSLSQFFLATDAMIGMACGGGAGNCMRLGALGGTNFAGCRLLSSSSSVCSFGFNSTSAIGPANTLPAGVFEGYRAAALFQVYREGVSLGAPASLTDSSAADVPMLIGRDNSTPVYASANNPCFAAWAGRGATAGATRDATAAAFAAAVKTLINTLAPGSIP